jgi:hypothetical protein
MSTNWYKLAKVQALVQAQETDDYRGMHLAPDNTGGAPLHDLTEIYPDDIYSAQGVQYYGTSEPFDRESIGIIQMARGKPNYPVTIYRAVPDENKEIKTKIKELNKLWSYRNKFGFFPMDNAIIHELDDKYPFEEFGYDGQQSKIVEDIEAQVEDLEAQLKPNLKLNVGDWVSISRNYAKLHGMSVLWSGYKILSKRVRAKDIFTDGNSIHEWGYYPQ